jgi:sugar phosphate isomerase/epimerase
MALGPDDLVLCAGTLARASLPERIEAAVAAGYRGLSLFPSDVRRARTEGLDDATLRSLLADNDLEIAELDPLMTWLPGVDPGPGPFATSESECYEIAESIGGRSINCVVFSPKPVPEETLVESFAALCDRAAERGLLVHLEFMPWTQVATALDALTVVEAAGRDNGGIMLDTWHHFRGPLSDEELRAKIPAKRILAVQLDDAPTEAEPDVIEETLNRRRVPGDGDIDLPGVLRFLREGGSPAPLGIEVFCEDLFPLPPTEAATRCADGVREALRRSRSDETTR